MSEGGEATIDQLGCAGQFVLWSSRIWVAAFKARQPAVLDLKPGFEAARIPDGLFLLDELMRLLASAARRPLDFRCVKCRRLGQDEALLLHCLAACQAGRMAEIDRVLSDWLPPSAARMAVRPAMLLAALLESVGLCLCEGSSICRADGRAAAYADPGLRRLQ